MNISPNEALAYAQSQQGVAFVEVAFVDRFEDEELDAKHRKVSANARRRFFYKLPADLPHVDVGDFVIVQVLDGKFGIGQVKARDLDPPSTDQYDFTYSMKWVVQQLDVARSKDYTLHDRDCLKAISRASLKTRVNEISAALGVDLATAVPALPGMEAHITRPTVEDAEIIDDGDRPESDLERDLRLSRRTSSPFEPNSILEPNPENFNWDTSNEKA